jgi:transcriptional regulator with XRE-family HTH domain
MDKDISTLLREIKAASNWSQSRIAAALETSQPTVNRILKGQMDCMGRTATAIAELHGRVCHPDFATAPPLAPCDRPSPAPS